MSWNFQSTAIVGSGAIGLYYGARLAAAGEDIRFLVRSDADAIRADGLHIDSVHGDLRLDQVRASPDPAVLGPVDLIVVAWKTTANAHLAETLRPLMHPGTQVLTLQNGLGNCEALAAIAGPRQVLGGLCFVCINRIAPGHVSHTAGGRVAIGEWRPDERNRAATVAARWKAAGIHATATHALEKAQWEKLVWNIPFNGLAIAEGGITTDVLLANPRTLGEIRAIMHEIVATARALGHSLDETIIEHNIERTRPMGPYRPSSMIDYLDGREIEIDAIWAEPLRRAAAIGVAMPRTAELLHAIRERAASRRE
jgi:2-dehydropantoate 2-reductase